MAQMAPVRQGGSATATAERPAPTQAPVPVPVQATERQTIFSDYASI